MLNVLISLCHGEFLFRSRLFCVLHASCTLIGTPFFKLEKFYSVILLKIFSGPWPVFFSFLYSYYLYIRSFHNVLYFLSVWGLDVLDLTFSLTKVSISFLLSSAPEILPSLVLVKLSSEVFVDLLKFLFPFLSQFEFSLVISLLLSCLELFTFYSTVCVFTDFIKRFIHILFKVLEHTHNSYFEVLGLRFWQMPSRKGYGECVSFPVMPHPFAWLQWLHCESQRPQRHCPGFLLTVDTHY